MAVTKDEPKQDDKQDDKQDETAKKERGPSLAKVVAALARNTTFTQHNPADAELVSDWLSKQEA